jgi:GTP-binding protein
LVDEAIIKVFGGAGGNGCRSFRREKYIPRGGPDGGNGGAGGSVYLFATRDKASLLDFKFKPKFEGGRGQHGKGSDMDGRSGEDIRLGVPVGTLLFDSDTGDLLCDLDKEALEYKAASGGRGGRGNKSFVSSTNRAPRKATPGGLGETFGIRLELRLMADVGLIGLPNAGKSSLIRVVSNAEPKVASYPFTTLEPNLGVVNHKKSTLVFADLPGLIEGASDGAGLGHRFLRHVSRNRCLLHLIDVSEPSELLLQNVKIVRAELNAYDPKLSQRIEFLVFTKADLFDEEALEAKQKELSDLGLTGFFISSHSGHGIEPLLDAVCRAVPHEPVLDENEDAYEEGDEKRSPEIATASAVDGI